MVQMHVTVPPHQQGPALSSFASLRVTGVTVQPVKDSSSQVNLA